MKKISLIALLLVTLMNTSYAQKTLKSLENSLKVDSTLYYENRTLRSQVINFSKLKAAGFITGIPMIQGVPVATYTQDSQGKIQVSEAAKFPKQLRPSFWKYKMDFVITPQFRASFGNPEKPVANQTNLLLNTNVVLPYGLSIYTGISFPLINQITDQPLNIRPAPTYLSQFINLGKYHYATWSAGLFYRDRFGFDIQYQKAHPASKISYGLDLNYTGFYYWYPNRTFRYTPFKDFSALFNTSWRWEKFNSQIRLTAGRFLYKDTGARLEFVRQFKKANIGFFGISSTNGSTVGLHLSFAIPPGKILENKYARLRTTEEFAWDYYYSTGYFIGERFRTNFRLDERLALYHRNYWGQFQK